MTENQTETRPATPAKPAMSVGQAIGEAVGQAQSVLAGLLVEEVRRRAPIARRTWPCSGSACSATPPPRTSTFSDLVDWLDLDPRAAAELADGLVASGLVTAGQQAVKIADDGAQLREKIAGSISAVTAPMYESLSSSDVETTVRTLRDLTTRVRATNPAAPAAPADPAEATGGRS